MPGAGGPVSVEFPRFGGLDLRQDPQENGGAIDLLNVDFDKPGTMRSRDNYSTFTTVAAAARYDSLFGYVDQGGGRYLLAGRGTTVQAIDSTGAVATSVAGKTTSPHYFCRWLDSSSDVVFCANGNDTVFAFNPTVPNFFVPAYTGTTPTGRFVAIQPKENRLVVAAQSTNKYRVLFSDAGTPTSFSANNYVDLLGDGEEINGIVAWRDFLFVFKKSRYFVFFGNSTDSSGNPVFNYRAVETGVGLVAPRAVAATADGVYFLGRRGVYRTTGGDPELLSGAIEPYFRNEGAPRHFASQVADLEYMDVAAAMCAHRDRIYLSLPTQASVSNDSTLVYDTRARWWSLWDLGAAALVPWRSTLGREEIHFAYSAINAVITNHIGRMTYTATTDAGVAMASRYRTGFWNPGQPGAESWVRECLIDGTGTVTVKTAVNDAATLGSGQAVTLGTSPAVAQGRDRRGLRGRNLSYEFSGTALWSISRVVPLVWGQRTAGLRAT